MNEVKLRCEIDWNIDEARKGVIIKDLDTGKMSVTNDSERVYEYFSKRFPMYRIFYYDSEGEPFEIVRDVDGVIGWLPWDGITI